MSKKEKKYFKDYKPYNKDERKYNKDEKSTKTALIEGVVEYKDWVQSEVDEYNKKQEKDYGSEKLIENFEDYLNATIRRSR